MAAGGCILAFSGNFYPQRIVISVYLQVGRKWQTLVTINVETFNQKTRTLAEMSARNQIF